MYFPRRAGKRTPKIVKSQNVQILFDFPMILPISICKFDAKNTPDAFKHAPDLFWRLRDRKTRKKHKTLKNLKLAPKKQLGDS